LAWLLRDGEVLASLEVPDSRGGRLRGMLRRPTAEGAALLLRPARAVHTVGMRRAIDVAFCDADMVVLATVCSVRPLRVTLPRRHGKVVIEAEAGSFDRWRLKVGDRLEVKGTVDGHG